MFPKRFAIDDLEEVIGLPSSTKEPGSTERVAAIVAMATGWFVALAVLAVGAGLALHASGVFTLPIPEVEGAARGSYLLWRQSVLETVPAWLEPLKFLAPTFLLVGIGLTLSRILKTIRARAESAEQHLPALIGPAPE